MFTCDMTDSALKARLAQSLQRSNVSAHCNKGWRWDRVTEIIDQLLFLSEGNRFAKENRND